MTELKEITQLSQLKDFENEDIIVFDTDEKSSFGVSHYTLQDDGPSYAVLWRTTTRGRGISHTEYSLSLFKTPEGTGAVHVLDSSVIGLTKNFKAARATIEEITGLREAVEAGNAQLEYESKERALKLLDKAKTKLSYGVGSNPGRNDVG